MIVFELLFVFIATVVGIRRLIRYAPVLRLIDEPNRRSIHRIVVPKGAGIVFTLAALTGLLLFKGSCCLHHFPLFVSLLLILTVGILDDRHNATPRFKFFVIALATLVLWVDGLFIDTVGRYFGVEIRFGFLAIPFTFFALAGFTNAMNLIDGLDGLAGSLGVLILSSFLLLGWRYHDPLMFQFSLVFLTALLAFLLFNWYPAAIFMGDSGSLTLGFLISTLSIRALDYLPSVSILYLGAIPILDTLIAMLRRKVRGRSVTAADRCHLHHLLLRRSGSIPKTVLMILLLQIPFTAIGLLLPRNIDQTVPFLFFCTALWVGYRWVLRTIRKEKIDCYPQNSKTKEISQ